jgi:hypothetical protein
LGGADPFADGSFAGFRKGYYAAGAATGPHCKLRLLAAKVSTMAEVNDVMARVNLPVCSITAAPLAHHRRGVEPPIAKLEAAFESSRAARSGVATGTASSRHGVARAPKVSWVIA